jgi:hypothetical protein
MQNFMNGIGSIIFICIYWGAGLCYIVGLYATAKYESIGTFLFTLCVPAFGQIYGAYVGFKYIFL